MHGPSVAARLCVIARGAPIGGCNPPQAESDATAAVIPSAKAGHRVAVPVAVCTEAEAQPATSMTGKTSAARRHAVIADAVP